MIRPKPSAVPWRALPRRGNVFPCPACGNVATIAAPGRGAFCSNRCVDEIQGEVVMVTVYLALAGGHQLVGVPNEALAYFWGRVQREANWARRVHALTTMPRVLRV